MLLMAFLLLYGCASMSEKECLTVNWEEKGYRDGMYGFPISRVEDHREACYKVGVIPDVRKYSSGHEEGIAKYCTPGNAINEGIMGRAYRNACPPELEHEFLENYHAGLRIYQARQRIDQLHHNAMQLEYRLMAEKDFRVRGMLRNRLQLIDMELINARHDLMYFERMLTH